jgi:putative phosphoesterase
MERFAAIADIHGNRWALEAVLEDIDRRGIQSTVNLGDDLFGPLDTAGTAEILRLLHLPSVAGNQDAPSSENSLAPFQLDLPGMRLFHGTPLANNDYLLESVHPNGVSLATQDEIAARLGHSERPPLMLCGHTHIPRVVTFSDTLIVNPGSVGLQAYSDDTPMPHLMETGSPHARYAILERHQSGWHVEQMQITYDWESAARYATANGRPDWAIRLRTGRSLSRPSEGD